MAEFTHAESNFRHVLLATDLTSISALAAQYAQRIASAADARLSILHVFNPVRMPHSETVGAHATPKELRKRDSDRLDALYDSIRQHLPRAEKHLLDGEPTPVVIDYASRERADLIVTGTHSNRALDRLLLGSTAEAIVRKSPCPVMTIGPSVTMPYEAGRPFSRILCAMDFGDAAKSAAPAAIRLANSSSSRLRFLHVLPSALNNGHPQPLVEQLFYNAMKHIISSNRVTAEIECAVQYGSRISDAILQDAIAQRSDLIILGVRRRGALASRLPAGIAFQVIEGAPCPVMTISD
jgi:nucleotide-binding universal stress UspA family protein